MDAASDVSVKPASAPPEVFRAPEEAAVIVAAPKASAVQPVGRTPPSMASAAGGRTNEMMLEEAEVRWFLAEMASASAGLSLAAASAQRGMGKGPLSAASVASTLLRLDRPVAVLGDALREEWATLEAAASGRADAAAQASAAARQRAAWTDSDVDAGSSVSAAAGGRGSPGKEGGLPMALLIQQASPPDPLADVAPQQAGGGRLLGRLSVKASAEPVASVPSRAGGQPQAASGAAPAPRLGELAAGATRPGAAYCAAGVGSDLGAARPGASGSAGQCAAAGAEVTPEAGAAARRALGVHGLRPPPRGSVLLARVPMPATVEPKRKSMPVRAAAGPAAVAVPAAAVPAPVTPPGAVLMPLSAKAASWPASAPASAPAVRAVSPPTAPAHVGRPVPEYLLHPVHSRGKHACGYRLKVGDLPSHVDANTIRQWLGASGVGMVSDVAVAERARSGALMAFVTIADWGEAIKAASAMWTWWVRVPVSVDERGWRYVPVNWMADRE